MEGIIGMRLIREKIVKRGFILITTIEIIIKRIAIFLDNYICIKGWGLIFYGVLPSYLALLGTLDIKIDSFNAQSGYFLIIIVILPILLAYMLIKDIQREWYLTTDFIVWRSVGTTILLLSMTTFISGISGIIHGKYILVKPTNLIEIVPTILNGLNAIGESFLFGILSLVISITFYITIPRTELELPGLPSSEFVLIQMKIRNNLRLVQRNSIWNKYVEDEDNLIKIAENIKQDIDTAVHLPINFLAKESLRPLCKNLVDFIAVLKKLKQGGSPELRHIIWKDIFGDGDKQQDYERYDSFKKLNKIKIGN